MFYTWSGVLTIFTAIKTALKVARESKILGKRRPVLEWKLICFWNVKIVLAIIDVFSNKWGTIFFTNKKQIGAGGLSEGVLSKTTLFSGFFSPSLYDHILI